MHYDWHICYPDQPEIEEKGRLEKPQVLMSFQEYEWDEQMALLEKIGFDNIQYNPSMSFHEIEGNGAMELTAFKQEDGTIGFSVWLITKMKKKTFFGLLARDVTYDIHADFDVKKSYHLLELFINQNYHQIENEIEGSSPSL